MPISLHSTVYGISDWRKEALELISSTLETLPNPNTCEQVGVRIDHNGRKDIFQETQRSPSYEKLITLVERLSIMIKTSLRRDDLRTTEIKLQELDEQLNKLIGKSGQESPREMDDPDKVELKEPKRQVLRKQNSFKEENKGLGGQHASIRPTTAHHKKVRCPRNAKVRRKKLSLHTLTDDDVVPTFSKESKTEHTSTANDDVDSAVDYYSIHEETESNLSKEYEQVKESQGLYNELKGNGAKECPPTIKSPSSAPRKVTTAWAECAYNTNNNNNSDNDDRECLRPKPHSVAEEERDIKKLVRRRRKNQVVVKRENEYKMSNRTTKDYVTAKMPYVFRRNGVRSHSEMYNVESANYVSISQETPAMAIINFIGMFMIIAGLVMFFVSLYIYLFLL